MNSYYAMPWSSPQKRRLLLPRKKLLYCNVSLNDAGSDIFD